MSDSSAPPKAPAEDILSKEAKSRFSSAAAFVESGVQEVYADCCSICLDIFTEEEPCAKTTCNHDYHLQCILEWAQRSSDCPMCWRSLSLKDADSQELLAACTHERALAQSLSPPSFLEEFDFRQRYSASYPEEADLERRIMQHLAAAAAGMSRGRLTVGSAREGSQPNPGSHAGTGPPIGSLFVRRFSTPSSTETGSLHVGGNTAAPPTLSRAEGQQGSSPSALTNALNNHESPTLTTTSSSPATLATQNLESTTSPPRAGGTLGSGLRTSGTSSGSSSPSPSRVPSEPASGWSLSQGAESDGVVGAMTPPRSASQPRSSNHSSRDGSPHRSTEAANHASGSDLASLGDVLKSRWAAASSRYRETLQKGTRSFREKMRLRGGAVADLSAKAREVGAGVVRAFERISDGSAGSSEREGGDRHGPGSSEQPSHDSAQPDNGGQAGTQVKAQLGEEDAESLEAPLENGHGALSSSSRGNEEQTPSCMKGGAEESTTQPQQAASLAA